MTTDLPPFTAQPVGIIHSPYLQPEGMPIQNTGATQDAAILEVFESVSAGLKDIADFEYLILITHLHQSSSVKLEVVPFLDNAPHGVFATRSPARPNHIGLSIVRLTEVRGRMLHFTGNDMVNGTPVLDIKPYVPFFDVRQTDRIGWFAGKQDNVAATRADDRMR